MCWSNISIWIVCDSPGWSGCRWYQGNSGSCCAQEACPTGKEHDVLSVSFGEGDSAKPWKFQPLMQFKYSKHAKLHFPLLVNETLLVLTTKALILLARPLSGCHFSYSFIPALPSLSGGAGPECWGVFPPACTPLVYHRPTWSEAQPPPHHLGTFPLQNLGRNPLRLSWEHHQCPPPTPGEIECALCKIAVKQAALQQCWFGVPQL